MRRLLFLIMLLIFPVAGSASTQNFNFTIQNYTGLNFESGPYVVELIKIAKPDNYVIVNLTANGSSTLRNLYYGETAITFNQIKLGLLTITETQATLSIEFPAGWGYPKTYTIEKPSPGIPNIVITKTVDKTSLNVGDVAEFKIKVENTGNATAYNMTLTEQLPNGFSNAPGSRFPPVISSELAAGASQELYYALKAVDPGTVNIEPATLNYGSKTAKSNPLTLTVAKLVQEKSSLATVISTDKNDINTDDTVKVGVKVTNTGRAPAKSVLIEGTPPLGMKVIEGDFRQVYDVVNPGESKEYRVILKATEPGSFQIQLRTVYNDDPIGVSASSGPVNVTEKGKNNYIYIVIPAIVLAVGLVSFAIKRHKEYSY